MRLICWHSQNFGYRKFRPRSHIFLALIRKDGDLAFARSNIKYRIRWIGLVVDHLTIAVLGDGRPPSAFDRKTSRSKGLAFMTYLSTSLLPPV